MISQVETVFPFVNKSCVLSELNPQVPVVVEDGSGLTVTTLVKLPSLSIVNTEVVEVDVPKAVSYVYAEDVQTFVTRIFAVRREIFAPSSYLLHAVNETATMKSKAIFVNVDLIILNKIDG